MNFFKIGAISALVVTAMGVAAGTTYAAPVTTPDVGYESRLVDDKVVTTLDAGTFELQADGKTVDIRDSAGATLVSLGLNYNLDGLQFPLDASVNDARDELILTPVTDVARAVPSVVHPVASTDENQRAMSAFSSQLGIATAIGGLVGLGIGAIVGCLAFVWFGVVGCLPGIAAGAAVGSVLGTLAVGGPTLLVAGIDLVNTLTAPPGTSKFANPTG